MLLVFAVWALAGFGYPSAPVPFAMNVVSKIIAFITALSLFFPEWLRGRGGLGRIASSRPRAPVIFNPTPLVVRKLDAEGVAIPWNAGCARRASGP